MNQTRPSYNERLFSGGIRGWLHGARFRWLIKAFKRHGITSADILELGCYDGKTIGFLEAVGVRVERYIGFDADWEGGIELGRKTWKGRPSIEFIRCTTPDDIPRLEKSCSFAVCMETLEHLPPELVGNYLDRLLVNTTDLLFVTIPIERGPVFLARQLLKRILGYAGQRATLGELWHGTLGKLEHVRRDHHLGFDDRVIIKEITKRGDLLDIDPIVPGFGPRTCNLQIGIVAKVRT